MGKRYTINHEVAYYECDINQNMTFPALLSVAIKASSDQSDELERGTDYINTLGITWVITQTEVTINRLPQVGEQIRIVTEPTEFNRYFCYRSYWVYDSEDTEDHREKSLRGSSQEIADRLKEELQKRVEVAGIEVEEVRITHLSYAPEIAAAMLQRQQAEAIIAARKKIVEGAVGMVEMALNSLSEKEVVELDDERKAAMVSNLLVVLCGNKDAQPIVNSGSIY